MKYASFWRRFFALLIDTIIISFIPGMYGQNETTLILAFAVNIAYFVWMNGAYGATIGKMVLKIKITKENGSKINYSDALIREIASLLSFIALFLGYLWMLWDVKKQTWHDHIAKTVVVKA